MTMASGPRVSSQLAARLRESCSAQAEELDAIIARRQRVPAGRGDVLLRRVVVRCGAQYLQSVELLSPLTV